MKRLKSSSMILGLLLSAMVLGSLTNMERYAGCQETEARNNVFWAMDDTTLDIVCLAASYKIVTTTLTVWIPIITFCWLNYYQTDSMISLKNSPSTDYLDYENFEI